MSYRKMGQRKRVIYRGDTMTTEPRSFALVVDNIVQDTFDIPVEAETAFVKEISGLNDIPVGTRFNPDTQSFYSDLEDKPTLESDSSTL